MELKYDSRTSFGRVMQGSNRTFMELKLGHFISCSARKQGSNRTFMELKCSSIRR